MTGAGSVSCHSLEAGAAAGIWGVEARGALNIHGAWDKPPAPPSCIYSARVEKPSCGEPVGSFGFQAHSWLLEDPEFPRWVASSLTYSNLLFKVDTHWPSRLPGARWLSGQNTLGESPFTFSKMKFYNSFLIKVAGLTEPPGGFKLTSIWGLPDELHCSCSELPPVRSCFSALGIFPSLSS